MKNIIIGILGTITILGLISFTQTNNGDDLVQKGYEYKIVTAVESIVPMGIGRSRIIENTDKSNVDFATIDRGEDTEFNMREVEMKIDNFKETKLANFYSAVGINFRNIASNDAMVTSKLNQLLATGWELITVVGGVESNAGKGDGDGIFITRYYFKRAK